MAVYFCELLRTAALHRVTPLSCPPYAEPDVICPPCYEHEVNKTLGHRKSRASDMSGAEISLHQRRSVEHGSRVSRPAALQLLLPSQVPMCKIIIKIGAQLR